MFENAVIVPFLKISGRGRRERRREMVVVFKGRGWNVRNRERKGKEKGSRGGIGRLELFPDICSACREV
jgi:hypothetical protein